jgi:hypothetical protein
VLGIVRTTRTERKRRKKKETEKDEEGGRSFLGVFLVMN